MATVFIPVTLRPLTGGAETVAADGRTVRRIIDALEAQHPGIRDHLVEGHGLRPGLSVVVDGAVASKGLLQPVGTDSEVHFLPAIGGG